MFFKEVFNAIGIEVNTYNLIVDYTLPDGRREHNAIQIVGNQVKASDYELMDQVKCRIPEGSRICMIVEIKGDFELSELSEIAETPKIMFVKRRMIYLDCELAKEYVDEIKRGIL